MHAMSMKGCFRKEQHYYMEIPAKEHKYEPLTAAKRDIAFGNDCNLAAVL
jgi:hypothetical protein